MTFPVPQEKPARRLNYAEKRKAGLVERKARQALRKVSRTHEQRWNRYRGWIKIAMHGLARCERCKKHKAGDLQPHHTHGRSGDNLFKVIPLCSTCHAWVHEFPNEAYAEGWLQPEYRNVQRQPNYPQPFTLLPPP